MVAVFHILVNHVVGINFLVNKLAVEVRHLLESHLLYQMRHQGVLHLYLAVSELALQYLLGIQTVLHLQFLYCLSYLGFSLARLHNVEPVLFRRLVVLRLDLNRVARVQLLAYRDVTSVDSAAHTFVAYTRVYAVGKVENRGTLGEFYQVALRSEHKHLVLIQIHLELVHQLQVVVALKRRAYVAQPLVQSRFALNALVSPMGSQTSLGNLVHAFGSDLHFHPLVLRTKYRDVQTLVAVRFRHRKPVAQTFGVRLIHISNERVGLPAQHLLLVDRRVDYDAYGE